MRLQRYSRPVFVVLCSRIIVVLGVLAVVWWIAAPKTYAAVIWDGEAGTQWWFDPVNWNRDSNNNTTLPPGNSTTGVTDTQINPGTSSLPGGEGVVYDPTNDPNYPPPGSITFPESFGPQHLRELYLSRQTDFDNLLTIRGDLSLENNMQLGRSSSTPGVFTTGRVNQFSGTVQVNNDALDIAATDTSGNVTGENYGKGIYDYRGGILEVSLTGGNGLRLSPSSSSVGAAGIGRFIMHNPSTPGYVRAFDYNAAAGAGVFLRLADGVTTGVGITEFHYENGGTRAIQVPRNLIINNGLTTTGSGAGGVRSSRLDLVLDAAPTIDISGVPQNLGLFDVDGSSTTGAGDLGDFFSSVDGSTLYNQNAVVSASFGSTQYNWNISYTGVISWMGGDPNTGVVSSVVGTGGTDVVLIGLSSVSAGLDGDYNDDGKVDAADYVLWRKNPSGNGGDPQGYTDWRANFGAMSGAGSSSSLTAGGVPEPSAMFLGLVGLIGAALRRRSR